MGPTPPSLPARRGIALVDDHQIVGLALHTALSRSRTLRLIGSFPTVDALLASGGAPSLVLLDLRLADGSSPADNVRRIRAAGAHVLLFTSAEDAFLVREGLRTDALGLVRKSTPLDEMLTSIAGAAHGRPVVTIEWAHAVESDPLIEDAALSPQEAKVLQLFADGAKSQTVAEQLHITVGTLEDYVRRIRVKYARAGRPAPTKVDLYKRAVEDGLLQGPSRR